MKFVNTSTPMNSHASCTPLFCTHFLFAPISAAPALVIYGNLGVATSRCAFISLCAFLEYV